MCDFMYFCIYYAHRLFPFWILGVVVVQTLMCKYAFLNNSGKGKLLITTNRLKMEKTIIFIAIYIYILTDKHCVTLCIRFHGACVHNLCSSYSIVFIEY